MTVPHVIGCVPDLVLRWAHELGVELRLGRDAENRYTVTVHNLHKAPLEVHRYFLDLFQMSRDFLADHLRDADSFAAFQQPDVLQYHPTMGSVLFDPPVKMKGPRMSQMTPAGGIYEGVVEAWPDGVRCRIWDTYPKFYWCNPW
jgi:hypothetical protein